MLPGPRSRCTRVHARPCQGCQPCLADDRGLWLGARDPGSGRRYRPDHSGPGRLIRVHVESTTTAGRSRSFALQPVWFLRFAALELFALWVIVATGAAVRLTSSGLGCRHWPGCEAGHPLPAKNYHAYIEFGNRVVGGVTILITLLVAVAAFWTPLGRRAKQLAVALFVGTLAQAPLGYLAVKTDLRWPVVAAHLLLSMVLLAGAVVLVFLACEGIAGRAEPIVPRELRLFGTGVAVPGLPPVASGAP